MQRTPADVQGARRAVVRRRVVLTLVVAALALLLAPLCTDGMSTSATSMSGSAADTAPVDRPTTVTSMLATPAECAAPVEPVRNCADVASHATAIGLPVGGVEHVLLACVAVLVAVLVATRGLRVPRGSVTAAVPTGRRVDWTRLGPPAPRPTPARLCVLRT